MRATCLSLGCTTLIASQAEAGWCASWCICRICVTMTCQPGMQKHSVAQLKSALARLHIHAGCVPARSGHAGRQRTATASRNACGRPASSSARKHSGSWWMRSVITEAASANRPPPKQAPRSKIVRRQLYSSAWSSSCRRMPHPQRYGGCTGAQTSGSTAQHLQGAVSTRVRHCIPSTLEEAPAKASYPSKVFLSESGLGPIVVYMVFGENAQQKPMRSCLALLKPTVSHTTRYVFAKQTASPHSQRPDAGVVCHWQGVECCIAPRALIAVCTGAQSQT